MRSALIALRVGGVAAALAAFTAVAAGPAVSVPAAPFAGEEDRGGVSVDPHQAAPGAQAKLRVRGCDARWATAKSSVFVAEVHLSSGRDGDGTLRGDAMISSRAEPGRHAVRVRCDNSDLPGSVEVVHHRGQEHGQDQGKDSAKDPDKDHAEDPAAKGHAKDPAEDSAEDHGQGDRDEDRDEDRDKGGEHPNPHRSPVRPVHAGGGGMAAELAETARAAERADGDGAAAAVAAKKDHGDDGPGLPHTVIGAVLAAAATLAVAGRALALRRRRSGE
ncbi:hypothetical protein HYE82_23700 [Streptomyces sp. BR123]|uniref:hypothetical protein n=1 Tax=Streptomyces sp. BR123 TaxID=2749828 RepID=UPI0015C4AC6B|nr:hypothetical protein [Streptomyces sp. BR123]NXY97325.1 hypothetical protein [Streptomyces sp. BR123]